MTVPPFENRTFRGRILLLERASLLREVQQLLLNRAGYETVASEDPAAALGQLDRYGIDAIVIDATVAEFVSSHFLRLARKSRPVSILAVLWQPGTLTPGELMVRGIDRVINLPANACAVVEAIDATLGYGIAPAAPSLADALATPTGADRIRIRVADQSVSRAAALIGEPTAAALSGLSSTGGGGDSP